MPLPSEPSEDVLFVPFVSVVFSLNTCLESKNLCTRGAEQPVSQSNQAEHRTSNIGRAFRDGMMYDEHIHKGTPYM